MSGSTKGLGFYNLVSFTKARFGEDGLRRFEESLAPEDREVLAGIVSVGWYDLALYARLLRHLVDLHGSGDLSLAEEYGRFAAEHDLTSIHKLVMKAVTPGVVLEQSMKVWGRFHDTGTWRVERSTHRAIGTLSNWGCVDEVLCRELVGYLEYMLALGYGGKRARVEHPRCRAYGSTDCVFTCTWI